MANNMTLPLLILNLVAKFISAAAASPAQIPVESEDLLVAMEEMQKANYFSFVMLVNIASPLDQKLTANVTFLMPKDEVLSGTNMIQQSVHDFLRRHSIPSALLFEHLERVPSGSLIPSSLPDYMLQISNGGRKNFSVNNVRIISRNLCTAGSSIRCHGIDGVLNIQDNNTSVQYSCSNGASPNVVVAKPPAAATVPSLSDSNQGPLIAPQPQPSDYSSPHIISGSSQRLCHGGLLNLLFVFAMIFSLTRVFIF